MSFENSKTSVPHKQLLNLSDKIVLNRSVKYVTISNFNTYYTWKNINYSYKNDKFKVSGPTWNDQFKLPDALYSVSDIQNYFEFIIKKHETVIDNPQIRIYVSKIENRVAFKTKTGCYLEHLMPGTMKLIGSTKSKITRDENGENISYLEITEVVLIHCNIVNNQCKHNSRVVHTSVPNKSYGQLLDISQKSYIFKILKLRIFIYLKVTSATKLFFAIK